MKQAQMLHVWIIYQVVVLNILLFSPRFFCEMIQFDLRTFFKGVGNSTTN